MKAYTMGYVIGSVILWAMAPVLALVLVPSALCLRSVRWALTQFRGHL